MKLSFGAVLAFAASALAVKFTNSNFDVEEGEPFTITWQDAEGPVTITLVEGPEKNLKPVTVITTSGSDGSFTWTPEDLPSGTYAFEIIDDTNVKNWSLRFQYTGTGTVTTTETPTSTAESSTSTEASTTTTSSSSETSSESTSTESEASSTTFAMSTTTEDAQTSTSATSTPTGSPPDLNNGQRFASPLGFVLVTVAALVFFN